MVVMANEERNGEVQRSKQVSNSIFMEALDKHFTSQLLRGECKFKRGWSKLLRGVL
jgi:hypothetical protein